MHFIKPNKINGKIRETYNKGDSIKFKNKI